MISDMILGTSIPDTLKVLGSDPTTNIIVLSDGTNKYLLTKAHLDELEKDELVTFNAKNKTLTATWRKAGSNSEFVRGDKQTATAKVTASDIAARLGI